MPLFKHVLDLFLAKLVDGEKNLQCNTVIHNFFLFYSFTFLYLFLFFILVNDNNDFIREVLLIFISKITKERQDISTIL